MPQSPEEPTVAQALGAFGCLFEKNGRRVLGCYSFWLLAVLAVQEPLDESSDSCVLVSSCLPMVYPWSTHVDPAPNGRQAHAVASLPEEVAAAAPWQALAAVGCRKNQLIVLVLYRKRPDF